MKLLSALALLSAAEAAIDHAALLRKAMPVDRQGRPRQLTAVTSINASVSIQFDKCVSLKTELSDAMETTIGEDSTLLGYWKDGQISTEQSYVLFGICLTKYCTYKTNTNLYMVDLPTWLELAGYRPQKTVDYCTACNNALSYCESLSSSSSSYYGGRELISRDLTTYGYVNCTTCGDLGCFDNSNGGGSNINIENVVTWVTEMAQCVNTGVQWNNIDLYSQFMCNGDGSGVEIGLFLDQYCTVYTSLASYGALFSDNAYLQYSPNVVTYPFVFNVNCSQDITWESPENANSGLVSDDGTNAVPNQYCTNLVDSANVLPLSNCALDGGSSNSDNNNGGSSYSSDFSSYSYDLTQANIGNAYAACKAINTIDSTQGGINPKNTNPFNSSNAIYSYNRKQSSSSMSGGAIFGIVVLVLAAVGALAYAGLKVVGKKDSKKQPLVDSALA